MINDGFVEVSMSILAEGYKSKYALSSKLRPLLSNFLSDIK